jgi:hypothetical protein
MKNIPTVLLVALLAVAHFGAAARLSDDAFARHVEKLRERAPDGFTIVVQKPFVVIGDESPQAVRRHAQGVVGWAVERLKGEYFAKDPDEILDVWLFKDDASYRKHAKSLFGDEPATPFGYYSPADRALVMNIATGGGTLVHEIVHPFVRANFPSCPAWFNEGLGSLYEACDEKDGRIRGLVNWRLRGLQRAIREKEVPSFKELMSTSDEAFYTKDRGTNYAQARYLCYYLQEKGLLKRFYDEFSRGVKEDPTGYETLKRVLDENEMERFKSTWEAFVMKLKAP